MESKKNRKIRVENIRMSSLREKFSLTQEQLANEVGVTQSMISHIEAGKRDTGKEIEISIVSFFNKKLQEVGEAKISVEWLFYEQIYDLES
jgi:putative transcriptional regulator